MLDVAFDVIYELKTGSTVVIKREQDLVKWKIQDNKLLNSVYTPDHLLVLDWEESGNLVIPCVGEFWIEPTKVGSK